MGRLARRRRGAAGLLVAPAVDAVRVASRSDVRSLVRSKQQQPPRSIAAAAAVVGRDGDSVLFEPPARHPTAERRVGRPRRNRKTAVRSRGRVEFVFDLRSD